MLLDGTVADAEPDVAELIARRSVADREAGYAEEVRRLLEAGVAVIRRCGTKASPRVADIVAEAGLSNDAFYRHFRSKDDLVTAILDDGTARVHRRLVREMDRSEGPQAKVGAWIAGVLTQAARPELADAIRAVLWNGARVSDDSERRIAARESLARPLHGPLAELGSDDPSRDAMVVCLATLSRLEQLLWRREAAAPADLDHLITFCLRGIRGGGEAG